MPQVRQLKFHPQRNWKLQISASVAQFFLPVSSSKELKVASIHTLFIGFSASFILKGIERRQYPMPSGRVCCVSSSKELKEFRGKGFSMGDARFHPQRNWKLRNKRIEPMADTDHVSSSKELKVTLHGCSVLVLLCFILKGIESPHHGEYE